MEGNGAKDPLFLQIKEEVESGYAPYVSAKQRGAKRHQGRRVVEGERAMQLQSDPFLGWTTMEGRDYLVRQLNDHKASIRTGDPEGGGVAGVCGGVWGDAGAWSCAGRRLLDDRGISGEVAAIRQGGGGVCGGVCGPD